jgi:dihydroflavonol-4-reductase
LGGEDVSLRDMLRVLAGLCGRRPPRTRLPRRPLFPLAYASEALARLSGREPFLTADALRMAGHHMFFSSAKAEAELGYTARPFAHGLADALQWFREQDYLR